MTKQIQELMLLANSIEEEELSDMIKDEAAAEKFMKLLPSFQKAMWSLQKAGYTGFEPNLAEDPKFLEILETLPELMQYDETDVVVFQKIAEKITTLNRQTAQETLKKIDAMLAENDKWIAVLEAGGTLTPPISPDEAAIILIELQQNRKQLFVIRENCELLGKE